MQELLTLQPIVRVNGTISLPGSKSISNRALLLAAQAFGTTYLINLLDSDDVRYMLNALSKLGVNYRLSADRRYCEIDGIGSPLRADTALSLFLGNAGTALRLLAATLCLQDKEITITGDQRMKERPIGPLVDALRQGGAEIYYLEHENYPPLLLRGGFSRGDITIDGSLSSQFLTALLMMAPLASQDRYIHIKGTLVSKPYIDITLALMKSFGIVVQHDQYQIFYINGGSQYRSPGNYLVEGDASSASYFLAAAAIRGGTVRVTGIGRHSVQGDIHFADVLAKMGATIRWGDNYIECTRGTLNAIDMDMNAIPDAAMTIATTALFTNGRTTTLRNIYNWRIKETNRLVAMATELRKVGATVVEGKDYLSISIKSPAMLKTANIYTYDDHRIAMCFALVALSHIPITIINPKCTHKTFPDFFEQLRAISMTKL
ncbi:3-phosphoshikimate 1-carboxyvinyltransferase [Candidatus Palibaumannia cicadellinicola]|uniref:3-phosphoshikimate 1-carboxyvinyltransferase n=1 Tax=Candidatus Palibaumannia cicadellinicola TaxID=186490 RepID=A0A2N4XX08_9GAMM|nr:3-phosphoshikimate 1-carboxyvinyltransferase [Candidatus Baumannia cicadellinicola]PLK58794.1 3-phosphoshikimate 1-carboxyvinyltransferase [Candidatus Baumannia cicadellinicola]